MSHWHLEDKAVLVSGANRGIGKAIALALGRAGARVGVACSGTNPASFEQAQSLVAELGGESRAVALKMNVANKDSIKESLGAFLDFSQGELHGLVNNAGLVRDNLMMRFKDEDWDALMQVNLKGVHWLTQMALRPMLKSAAKGSGASIVNIGSVVAEMGSAGQVPYAASKAAIIGMTKSLAHELGSRQIRVNVLAPGFVQTDMTADMDAARRSALLGRIPLGRLGGVDDIASGALFLISPLSGYVTGQVLGINGGLYM